MNHDEQKEREVEIVGPDGRVHYRRPIHHERTELRLFRRRRVGRGKNLQRDNEMALAVPIDLQPIPIKGPSGRIYRMYQPKGGDHQANHWRRGSFYEMEILAWAYEHPDYFARVLDIGASIGNHAIFFAGELGAQVLAVEPYTDNIVRTNAVLNGLQRKIETHKVIIGKPGFCTVKPGPAGNVGMTTFPYVESDIGQWVMGTRTIPQVCGEFIPTAVKIDAEGSDALWGAFGFLTKHKPLIMIEEIDADRLSAIDGMLGASHERIDRVFNATPTHIYLPT